MLNIIISYKLSRNCKKGIYLFKIAVAGQGCLRNGFLFLGIVVYFSLRFITWREKNHVLKEFSINSKSIYSNERQTQHETTLFRQRAILLMKPTIASHNSWETVSPSQNRCCLLLHCHKLNPLVIDLLCFTFFLKFKISTVLIYFWIWFYCCHASSNNIFDQSILASFATGRWPMSDWSKRNINYSVRRISAGASSLSTSFAT
jgi:hypothetical protein